MLSTAGYVEGRKMAFSQSQTHFLVLKSLKTPRHRGLTLPYPTQLRKVKFDSWEMLQEYSPLESELNRHTISII